MAAAPFLQAPLFFLHMGDLFYGDIADDDDAAFQAAYKETWASEPQAALYRSQPVVYMWDDHDFGENDSNGASGSRAAARRAYDRSEDCGIAPCSVLYSILVGR